MSSFSKEKKNTKHEKNKWTTDTYVNDYLGGKNCLQLYSFRKKEDNHDETTI